MSESRCRWVASDQPRVLAGRHEDGCEDQECRGCLACPMDHCRVCGIEHAEGACPGCVGEVRVNIAEIVQLCSGVPKEAEHKGVESEAMILLGPTADPEAWGHVTASIAAGRIPTDWRLLPDDWTTTATDENHPLLVLGDWEMIYRDALGHATIECQSIVLAAGYLNRHLTEAAAEQWVAFEAFAKAVDKSRAFVEGLLHDGEQIDQGAPCLTCGQRLERIWGATSKDDMWRCQRCREDHSDTRYALAMKAEYIAKATWLTDADMQTRTGVKASTIRSWANDRTDRPALIRKTLHTQRTVYSVEDVQWIHACSRLAEPAA